MRNILFWSDTHYDHANILRFTDSEGNLIRGARFSSVEEMNETMIENHNRVVTSDSDVVYHLGDVTFQPNKYARIASRLRGRQRLLLGNHDDGKNYELTRWFQKIGIWRIFKEEGIVFSHIPLREDQFRFKVGFNGHGHVHTNDTGSPVHINLSVEAIDYTPVSMDEIQKIMKDRS